MTEQNTYDYNRIAKAIEYIREHFQQQPNLNEIADAIHISPFHFQRLFSDWAGVSPKKFMQYTSIEYAKKLLANNKCSLSEASFKTGLSSTSRLHDLFIKIEGMTPGEFKNGGKSLKINYDIKTSPFGNLIIASTEKGICHMSFFANKETGVNDLKSKFPNAKFQLQTDEHQSKALLFFNNDWDNREVVKLHINGTPFQLQVWRALLKIPFASLDTYGNIAEKIDNVKASRAVGTAIGKNPIAYLIPCHRVIQSSGNFGEYRWNKTRKSAIIGWEACREKTA
ncbi:methylated-DNA--[protein]-cysteine S-methyltransferase [uncultured Croceitalea sp.]|uniref:methylated-DNA--[protein]-cysteine S-methyltransferase n=1 Tax=uncultured Croceitalea sp. TaxID=1798908 RepID=UPI0033068717